MDLVTIDDIRAAAKLIRLAAVRTPLLPCPWSAPDHPLWLKPEGLQPTGAFKIRGAYHALAVLPPEVRVRGVVAYSSGNHAQAVAYAARLFGVPAAIVVDDATPEVKVAATTAHGADVLRVPMAEREVRAVELAAQRGATLIPPFDHPAVIAGQGTIGLEIVEDLPEVDVVLVPISGGGLLSGIGVAIKALRPKAKVIGVEPEVAADTRDSLRAGRLISWSVSQRSQTLADGLRATPSELTFAHLQATVDDIVTVTESEIRSTVRWLANESRLVAEPSGAVTTAAYLHRGLPPGRTVAVVSGGNLDPDLLLALLAGE